VKEPSTHGRLVPLVAQPYIHIQESSIIHPLRHIYFSDGDGKGQIATNSARCYLRPCAMRMNRVYPAETEFCFSYTSRGPVQSRAPSGREAGFQAQQELPRKGPPLPQLIDDSVIGNGKFWSAVFTDESRV
jgi:hypothetical protein